VGANPKGREYDILDRVLYITFNGNVGSEWPFLKVQSIRGISGIKILTTSVGYAIPNLKVSLLPS
jgi:hypothetical protein